MRKIFWYKKDLMELRFHKIFLNEQQSKKGINHQYLKGKGRPKTLGVKQEQLVHNDENHWTNSEIAGLFLETLAHHGVYKLPIETGVKAKKKWENLQLSNKEDVKSKFAAKELEIKVCIMFDIRIKQTSWKKRPKNCMKFKGKETTTLYDKKVMKMLSSMIKET